MADEEDDRQQAQALIAQLQAMKEESQVLAQKISELDQERQEHVLVTETLEKLDSDLKDNMDKLTAVINELYGKLQGKEKEMQEFQSKHNIRLRNQPEKRPAPAQDSATSGSGYRV